MGFSRSELVCYVESLSQRKKHLLEKLRSLGENGIPKTKEAAQ